MPNLSSLVLLKFIYKHSDFQNSIPAESDTSKILEFLLFYNSVKSRILSGALFSEFLTLHLQVSFRAFIEARPQLSV